MADSSMIDESDASSDVRTPRESRFFTNLSQKSDGKYFNDPIHGHYFLRPASCAAIDTKAFQRLRKLKQLGFSYYVYPGASHNRFEHCLGVGHLAGLWSQELLKKYSGEPHEEIERYSALVELAGLCHDLGHGPYSHTWEKSILPSLGYDTWSHEDMSLQLVDYIFDSEDIADRFGFLRRDVEIIKDMIVGVKPTHSSDIPLFLYDIVNNRSCGIDVDKLDYLQRDSLYTNVHSSAPYGRLIQFTKPSDSGLIFRLRERENLSKIFTDRAILHKEVYTHKTVRVIDIMAAEAMQLVGGELSFIERSRDIHQFLNLTDTIVDFVHYMYNPMTPSGVWAKHLLDRIERRQLYKLCGQLRIPESRIEWFKTHKILPENISTCNSTDIDLRPEDIFVDHVYIDRGKGARDPIQYLEFYKERQEEDAMFDDQAWPLQWMWIRAYCKDDKKADAARQAFDNFARCLATDPVSLTPEKHERRTRPVSGSMSPEKRLFA